MNIGTFVTVDIVTFASVVILVVYVPIAFAFFYVWFRYGRGDRAVAVARALFAVVSIALICYIFIV